MPRCPTRVVTLTSPPGHDTQNGWAQQKKQKVYQCFSQQANAELQLICTIKLISFVVHTKANYINIPQQTRETFLFNEYSLTIKISHPCSFCPHSYGFGNCVML
jgi:hypothetical protein